MHSLYAVSFVQMWCCKAGSLMLRLLDRTPLADPVLRTYFHVFPKPAMEYLRDGEVVARLMYHPDFPLYELGNEMWRYDTLVMSDYSGFRCVHFLEPYICPKRILRTPITAEQQPVTFTPLPRQQQWLMCQLRLPVGRTPIKLALTDPCRYSYFVENNQLNRSFLRYFAKSVAKVDIPQCAHMELDVLDSDCQMHKFVMDADTTVPVRLASTSK